MSGARMQYAKLPTFAYQIFDPTFVKHTNIPLFEPKKPKEESPPADKADEKAGEKAAEVEASGCEIDHS